MGIVDALRNGKVEYTGNKASNVNIELGKGDAQVTVHGNNVDITAGTGNQHVVVLGNDVDIKLDQGAAADWDFNSDFDSVAVISDKGGANIDTGKGSDTVIAVADNVNINMGEGKQHTAIYYGDNVNINLDNANTNIVMSADKALASDNLLGKAIMFDGSQEGDIATTLNGINIGKAAAEAVENRTRVITNEWDIPKGTTKEDFLNGMKTSYNLDDANMAKLEELYDNGDLFKTYTQNGKTAPAYAIIQSEQQRDAAGNYKYVLARVDGVRQGKDGNDYIHCRGLQDGSFKECIATNYAKTEDYTVQEKNEHWTEQYYKLDGTKNLNINIGDAKLNVVDVTAIGDIGLKAGNFGNFSSGQGSYINIDESVRTESELTSEMQYKEGKTVSWASNLNYKTSHGTSSGNTTYTSPLVFDTNKDGIISAKSGEGIDANGDGIGDGYATNGDKMLAMSDLNGNGNVDGAEVFGNKTVSPFTGKSYNAANGFEALKAMAQEAEKFTGVKCYNDGQVDLASLKAALATVGVNLGYVSDANTKNLEALEDYDVAQVAVDAYDNVDETGDVQHRQQGTYTAADGTQYSVDDVWFKDRNDIDQMLDRLNRRK